MRPLLLAAIAVASLSPAAASIASVDDGILDAMYDPLVASEAALYSRAAPANLTSGLDGETIGPRTEEAASITASDIFAEPLATEGIPKRRQLRRLDETITLDVLTELGPLNCNAGIGDGVCGDNSCDASIGETCTTCRTDCCSNTGATLETWTNVGGTTLNAIDWNSNPTFSSVIPGDGNAVLEGPVNTAENYAERIRTYLVPPVTGSYTFWIASDDQGSLLLSSDSDPANAIEIASVPYWANPREYGKYPEQRSDAISLVAGEVYYLEAKMKEGGGGDNLSVAWEYPGQSQQVIPAVVWQNQPFREHWSQRRKQTACCCIGELQWAGIIPLHHLF